MTKISLTKDDYKFIDDFMLRYKVPAGQGYHSGFAILLDEYKKHTKKKKKVVQ